MEEETYVDKIKKPNGNLDIRDTTSGYQTAQQTKVIIDNIIGND